MNDNMGLVWGKASIYYVVCGDSKIVTRILRSHDSTIILQARKK